MTLLGLRPRPSWWTRPCQRWFSATARQKSGQFTIVAPESASKDSVLAKIGSKQGDSPRARSPGPDNAAVVLASPEFATWLEDESFMATLLQRLPLSSDGSISLVAAVVAGLTVPHRSHTSPGPVSGLSIAYGHADALVPGLWHGSSKRAARRSSRGSIGSDLDTEAAITVDVPPLVGSQAGGSTKVTLPLVNTIFQNGRRSTLLASLWRRAAAPARSQAQEAEPPLQCAAVESREHQRIVPQLPASDSTAAVSVPVFAISQPLTIASGLGNIVRQVVAKQADGVPDDTRTKAEPAARTLEAAIPALLAARRRAQPALQDGALAVWGLVVPAHLVPFYEQLRAEGPGLAPVASDADHSPAAEQQAATAVSTHFTALLAAGCRLHRILSGGGGWGPKQGLLSLDPQMSHPAAAGLASDSVLFGEARPTGDSGDSGDSDGPDGPDGADDEAMLSFIRSFRHETDGRVEGVAMPGAAVQFFVAPVEDLGVESPGTTSAQAFFADTGADAPACRPALSFAFGAQAASEHQPSPTHGTPDASRALVAWIPNHFGAVASSGVFLAAATRTKLDVPRAQVWGEVPAGRSQPRA